MVTGRDPVTREEWQEAVDQARFYLLLDSARQYGLVTGGPDVDVDRCVEILALGLKQGITPTKMRGPAAPHPPPEGV
jgi:hypothetical protein